MFKNDYRRLSSILRKGYRDALNVKASVDFLRVGREWNEYLDGAEDTWRSTFISVYEGAITGITDELSLAMGMAFDVSNPFAEEWFNEYVLEFIPEILDTTRREVGDLLHTAVEEGWGVDRVENALGLLFDRWITGQGINCDAPNLAPEAIWFCDRLPLFRREMIARTEIIRALNVGTKRLYEDWGVGYIEWVVTPDDRLCDWCASLNNKKIPIDKNFFEKGDRLDVTMDDGSVRTMFLNYGPVPTPPLHPNCRCTIVPVIE